MMTLVLQKLCRRFDWRYQVIWGRAGHLPEADLIFLLHGIVDAEVDLADTAAIHVIRDPRDLVLSGYDFHRATDETWCTNVPSTPVSPIGFPLVDMSQAHRSEDWKHEYVAGLGGRSYQQNLSMLPRGEGIQFEIDRYTNWTAEQMLEFQRANPSVPVVRFEDFQADFDGTFARVFRLLGVEERWLEAALAVARTEDIERRPAAGVAANAYTVNRGASRWRRDLEPEQIASMKRVLGEAVVELGYADSNDW